MSITYLTNLYISDSHVSNTNYPTFKPHPRTLTKTTNINFNSSGLQDWLMFTLLIAPLVSGISRYIYKRYIYIYIKCSDSSLARRTRFHHWLILISIVLMCCYRARRKTICKQILASYLCFLDLMRAQPSLWWLEPLTRQGSD